MNIDNPFDKKLEANKHMPESMRGALVDVIDALDFTWAGAQAVFGSKATPETAVMLIPHVMARAAALRQQRLAAIDARTEGVDPD